MPHSSQDLHKKLLGKRGEKLVEQFLQKRRYKILERNYVTPFGEADLIVLDKDETVFVEVKTRESEDFGSPREAVDKYKQERYRRIAQFYWLRTGEEPNARFDVAEVYADGRIEYYENAF